MLREDDLGSCSLVPGSITTVSFSWVTLALRISRFIMLTEIQA